MRVLNIISYSVAAGLIVFLIGHTLGSPVGGKVESGDAPTTVVPDVVNDESVGASTIRGRQEEAEDEDDDDDATAAPVVPSTIAPVPRPQYNESTIQSELNYVTQFQIGSNGSEALPQVPAQPDEVPDVPPPTGSVPVPANPVENAPTESVVESRNSSAPAVVPSEVPAVVSSSVAPTDEDDDETDEDEATEAPPAVRQPEDQEAQAGEPPVIPVKPLTLASTAGGSDKPVVQSQPQTPVVANAAVPQPAVAPGPVEPQVQAQAAAAQTQEADSDTDQVEGGDADPDSENEITQDQKNSDAVVTTGAPSTFEAEYNYTVQFINDNQARKQDIENDESEEGNSTVKPLNNKSTFESEYQHTSQFLSEADSRADCACGRVPYSIPLGDSSGINEYPWTVAIVRGGGLFGGGRPHCAGTLINDKYVITASHCMDGLYPSDIQVWMTVHKTFDSVSSFGTTKVNVQEILMHPNYNRNSNDNDVALIKLSQPIDISQKNYFVPACIPAGASDYSGTLAKVVAWSNGQTNQICKADMPVLSNYVCQRDTKHRDKITENMLCAGFLTPNTPGRLETCIGDAGGPLLSPNGGRQTLIGIVSWGYRSAGDYSPTVYSRVSGYTDWILHNTRDADWCGN